MTVDLVDDSWLIVPHEAAQVSLSVHGATAWCALGHDGCVLPAADDAAERRQLNAVAKSTEPAVDAGADGFTKTAEQASTETSLMGKGVRSEGMRGEGAGGMEDDDHVAAHAEAEELADLENMGGARAPLCYEGSTLRQLRALHSATPVGSTGGDGEAGGREAGGAQRAERGTVGRRLLSMFSYFTV